MTKLTDERVYWLASCALEASQAKIGPPPFELAEMSRALDELPIARANLRNRCDTCGARTIDNCQICGAPQCCPQCCKIVKLTQERDIAQGSYKILAEAVRNDPLAAIGVIRSL